MAHTCGDCLPNWVTAAPSSSQPAGRAQAVQSGPNNTCQHSPCLLVQPTWYCCIIIICGCHIIMPGGAPGGMPGMPAGPPMPPAACAAASPPALPLAPGAAEVPLAALLVPLAPLPAESPLGSGAAAASGPLGLGSEAAAAAAGIAIMPFICRGSLLNGAREDGGPQGTAGSAGPSRLRLASQCSACVRKRQQAA